MKTRHTTRPPAVPVVERAVEGCGGGGLANGPMDEQQNRESNLRRCRCQSTRPSRSHLCTRPLQVYHLHQVFDGLSVVASRHRLGEEFKPEGDKRCSALRDVP